MYDISESGRSRVGWRRFSVVDRSEDNRHIFPLDTVFPFLARAWELRINAYLEPNWHDYAEIALIEKGSGLCRIGSVLSPLEPGDIVLIAPKTRHTFWSGPGNQVRFRAVYFHPELVVPTGSGPVHQKFMSIFTGGGPDRPFKAAPSDNRLEDAIRRICRIDGTPVDTHDRLEALSNLYMILSLVDRLVPANPPGVRERMAIERWERLHRLMIDKSGVWPSIEDAAMALGMSRWGFCRFFKRETGLTWTSWLRHRAVDHAKELLTEGKLTVVDIAMEVGFSNLSWFNRSFHEITGQTPTQYRRTIEDGISK